MDVRDLAVNIICLNTHPSMALAIIACCEEEPAYICASSSQVSGLVGGLSGR